MWNEVKMIHVRGNIEGGGTMDSILTSVKKMLGIIEEDEHFDTDIIMHINSVFAILNQIGAGPPEGFTIKDKTDTWSSYISNDKILETVKSYMYLKVRLIFDPPASSVVADSMNKMINELEYRISVHVDPSSIITKTIK